MKFNFNMPYWSAPPSPELMSQKVVMDLAAAVEAAGFEAAAFTEHPAADEAWRAGGGHDALDPFIGLAFCSAATTHLKLLTYITVLPYRNPLLLAKTTAVLDALSGGRLQLGVGAGYQASEFAALGVNFEERHALFDESLEVLKLAWTGEPIYYKGIHFDAQGVTCQPRPAQRPGVPIIMGGSTKRALERVVAHGMGWMAQPNTVETAKRHHGVPLDFEGFVEKVKLLRQMARDAGRTDHIEVHYPIAMIRTTPTMAEHLESAKRLSGFGVDVCGWTPQSRNLPGIMDEIKRFCDEVVSKI